VTDVTNKQIVGVRGDNIVLLAPRVVMGKTEALVHAAWIVSLADQSEEFADFRAILRQVLGT
jgi:hypothetical protein